MFVSKDIFWDSLDQILNFYFNLSRLVDGSDFFTAIFLFSFAQLIILGSISEVIWPTAFFNKTVESSFVQYKVFSYTDTLSTYLVKTNALYFN